MAASDAQAIRADLAHRLRAYWQQHYDAYKQGHELPETFLAEYALDRSAGPPAQPTLPASVQAAYDYYQHAVEDQDWGNVRLYRAPVGGAPVYVVRVTTDGDDGWL